MASGKGPVRKREGNPLHILHGPVSLGLAARDLLYAPYQRQDNTYHGMY